MWKPDESLDDYIVRSSPEVTSEAPRPVSLQRTGEVEVLNPLTRPEVRTGFRALRVPAARQPLWFRRFIIVGSGALVMIALVLVSAILVGISDSAGGPDVANERPDDALTQSEELFGFDLSIPLGFISAKVGVDIAGLDTRQRRALPTIRLASHKPRRQLRPPLRPEEPNFIPTTLVIYAKNGVINTRIEPWFAAADKKATTFNN